MPSVELTLATAYATVHDMEKVARRDIIRWLVGTRGRATPGMSGTQFDLWNSEDALMFVQRLKNWVHRLLTRIGNRFRYVTPPARAQQPVHAGAHVTTARAAPAPTLGRWLDDGRRLRPRLRRATPSEPPRTDRAAEIRPGSLSIPQREAALPSRSRPLMGDESAAPVTLTPARPAPPAQPVIISAEFEDAAGASEEQRSLMSLKYLVRIGLYNEGFTSSQVPDQYQHSLGLDETPPEA